MRRFHSPAMLMEMVVIDLSGVQNYGLAKFLKLLPAWVVFQMNVCGTIFRCRLRASG